MNDFGQISNLLVSLATAVHIRIYEGMVTAGVAVRNRPTTGGSGREVKIDSEDAPRKRSLS